jgi:YidC/Oxa1 family membrane protein insertase
MMDRKTILVFVLCMVAFVGYSFLYNYLYPPKPPQRPQPVTQEAVQPQPEPATVQPTATLAAPAVARPSEPRPPEAFYALKTALQKVEFTTYGGAIKKITLLPRADGIIREPMEFASPSALPAMATSGLGGLEADAAFELVAAESTDRQVVFRVTTPTGLIVTKTYAIAGDYQLDCKLSVANPAAQTAEIAPEVSLGTARALNGGSIYDLPGVDWYNGKVPRYDVRLAWFDPSNFLWLIPIHGKRELYRVSEQRAGEPVVWAATKNQYFATVITPAKPAVDLKAFPVQLLRGEHQKPNDPPPRGIAATMILQKTAVEPGKSVELSFHLFSGPKEYNRLKVFPQHQHEVMELGVWIGNVARPLLWSMLKLRTFVGNYGVAIIIITILIKLLFWPVTASSMRSMKRMQKFQPLMTQLREKYKDDPQRLNQEMMKLYREHKINPLGGCLPMLIQIPIFFGLFAMLRGAIELRGAPFLWIRDLSQPDTIFSIPGLGVPVNPLPLLMTATMIWQQKITPTTVDPKQAKMMMFMPLIMLLFFYNASSGLALYWTVQQILSVGQQYWMNAQKDEPVPATPPPKTKKKKQKLPWKS